MTELTTWMQEALASSTARDTTVVVVETHEVNLRWAANALTTNGVMASRQATVIATADVPGGVGVASLTGPLATSDDLSNLVRRAATEAQTAPADDEAQHLPSGPSDDDFDSPAYVIGPEEFDSLATDLGMAFDRAREADHLLFGFAEYHRTTTWLANSAGLRRRTVVPMGRLELNAKAPDLVNSAWVGAQTNDFTDVDVPRLHAELERRLAWGERRVDLPPGRYETLLPPGAVVDLLVYTYWSMSGRDAQEGRSVFAGAERGRTREGERLSELPVSIVSDPGDARLPEAPFAIITSSQPGLTSVFDTGVPVGPTTWVDDGQLRALVRTRAGMERAGLEGELAYPVENLIIDAGGTTSLEEMIASTTRGLLLTCLWYIRTVDPQTLLLTGLTRDGVYLIEDGNVVAAVNNFRFNESPVDLLRRATEASRAEHTLCREWNDWFTKSVAPALRIPDFNMSTVSQAH